MGAGQTSQNDGPEVTFKAGEAITKYAMVMIEVTTGDVIETVGTLAADINVIGVAQEAAADGEYVRVRMFNCVATCKVIADLNNIVKGDSLYTADNGEVTDTVTSGSRVGIAMSDSDTALDIIEMAVALQTFDTIDDT